jgi:hypothetical protein
MYHRSAWATVDQRRSRAVQFARDWHIWCTDVQELTRVYWKEEDPRVITDGNGQ